MRQRRATLPFLCVNISSSVNYVYEKLTFRITVANYYRLPFSRYTNILKCFVLMNQIKIKKFSLAFFVIVAIIVIQLINR